MGTWGTAIFSDDTACEVRDDYREMIGDGLSSEEATRKMVNEYSEEISDDEEGPVFWLALASTQWKCGRLLNEVKENAITIIDSGLDLVRWEEDDRLMKKRKAVLAKLKTDLQSEQPEPKKIRKAFKCTCEFEIKDAVSFRLRSGKYVILKVVSIKSDKGGDAPIFELCDWIGEKIPSKEEIGLFKPACLARDKFSVGAVSKKEYPKDRLAVVAKNVKINFDGNPPYIVELWRSIDGHLERSFGFK